MPLYFLDLSIEETDDDQTTWIVLDMNRRPIASLRKKGKMVNGKFHQWIQVTGLNDNLVGKQFASVFIAAEEIFKDKFGRTPNHQRYVPSKHVKERNGFHRGQDVKIQNPDDSRYGSVGVIQAISSLILEEKPFHVQFDDQIAVPYRASDLSKISS